MNFSQPSFSWSAKHRYIDFQQFELEVCNIFETYYSDCAYSIEESYY